MKFLSKFLTLMTLFTILFFSCSKKKNDTKTNSFGYEPIIINKINLILDNSGSMSGFLVEDAFIRDVTNFIAELDKLKHKSDDLLEINNMEFFTFNNTFSIKPFNGNAHQFCNVINEKGFATVKTSPIDEFIKSIVDSIDENSIYIFVTDLIIDKINRNIKNYIQAQFNIIFNNAKNSNLGLIIYRLTSEYTGTYFPVSGSSYRVSNIERPYFIMLFGPNEKLKIISERINDFKTFNPINEISFGIPYFPRNIEVLNLSNRYGNWRFKKNEFFKADLKKNKLKFTLAMNLQNFPKYMQDLSSLNDNIIIESSSLQIDSFRVYDKNSFQNLIHKKEKDKFLNNTHFIEVNISQINSSENNFAIKLKRINQDWFRIYSTDNDYSLANDNNLKTFLLENIILGISNAYEELADTSYLFKINYKLTK